MIRPLIAARMNARRRSAFTLLEVLIVVAILVVLASIAGIYVFRSYEDAKKDTARNQTHTIEKACKMFLLKVKRPPTSAAELIVPVAIEDGSGQMTGPFLEGGQGAITDPWGKVFTINGMERQNGEIRFWVGTTSSDNQTIQNFDPQQPF